MAHVMPPYNVGAVCEPVRVFVAPRSEEQRCRIDCSTGKHNQVSRVFFNTSIPPHNDFRDLVSGGRCLQSLDKSIRKETYIRISKGRVYCHHLSVRFCVDEARKSVARAAADTAAAVRIHLIEHHSKRSMEGAESFGSKMIAQFLNPTSVTYCRVRIWRTSTRLCRIFSAHSV